MASSITLHQFKMSATNSASCAEFGGAVDSGALVEFVDAGGNLLLALDTGVSDQVRLKSWHLCMLHRRSISSAYS
jgi:hypothetical protein